METKQSSLDLNDIPTSPNGVIITDFISMKIFYGSAYNQIGKEKTLPMVTVHPNALRYAVTHHVAIVKLIYELKLMLSDFKGDDLMDQYHNYDSKMKHRMFELNLLLIKYIEPFTEQRLALNTVFFNLLYDLIQSREDIEIALNHYCKAISEFEVVLESQPSSNGWGFGCSGSF